MYDEYVRRAVAANKPFDDLPPRIRGTLGPAEWKTRVKEYCIQRGCIWSGCLAITVCSEQEYYDDLLRLYKQWLRVRVTVCLRGLGGENDGRM